MNLSLSITPAGVAVRQLAFSMKANRILAAIEGATWDPAAQVWVIPPDAVLGLLSAVTGAKVEMTPEVRAAVQRAAPELAPPVPVITDYEFKTKPYNHQVLAFHAARDAYYHAFLMEMGTGKTKAAIDTVSYKVQRGQVNRLLVLCPKALLFNWERELSVHSPLPAGQRLCVVATGDARAKTAAIRAAGAGFALVVNYHTLLTHEAELDLFVSQGRTAVLADEATAIKNPAGKMFKAAKRLGQSAVCRYLLTGTPITQGPLDAFALFEFLKPGLLGHRTFTSFKAEFALYVKLQNIPVPVLRSYKNLDRLAALIAPHSTRVLKSECLDLPDKVYRLVELDMGAHQAEVYRRMRDEAVVDVGPDHPPLTASVVLTRLLRLQQIASGFLPVFDEYGEEVEVRELDGPKVDACKELVQEALTSQQKVIVWCRFTWEVNTLAKVLGTVAKVVTYHGATDAEERQANVDAIQTGDAQVFIGQIQTGGMGITLTAASTVIYYSNTFSLADRLQSEDRAHRIGQTKSVLYIDLVCRGTVDRVLLAAHREKKNLADLVTGDNLKLLFGA